MTHERSETQIQPTSGRQPIKSCDRDAREEEAFKEDQLCGKG